ncbi:MAG: tetratricopeptide repeat protein [Bacteroidetes bacterium]|nr:tetratricopeptide repeat protein [Bacteroidota bacterium]
MPKKYFLLIPVLWLAISAFGQGDKERWAKWEVDGDTLMNRRDFVGAAGLYNKILGESGLKEKASFKILYKRAICYYSAENFDLALSDATRFITEFPENARARLLRALIYRHQGNVDDQLSDLTKYIELRGEMTSDLMRWRGSLLADKGEFAAAKKDLLTVAAEADDAELEATLGLVYYSLNKKDSALVRINKAIVLDVNYPASYIYAGSFCLQDENYELALKYLNLALRVDPGNKSATFYKGVSLVELNKIDEGCRCLRKAFAAGEDEAEGYLKEFCYEVFK